MSDGDERDAPFITDLERSGPLYDAATGEEVMHLPRYGVWCFDFGKGAMQVRECSDDLMYLQTKYQVPDKRVIPLLRKGK
jgi:hypothetical protein